MRARIPAFHVRIARAAAIVLLAAISLDVLADAGCDAPALSDPGTIAVRAPEQGKRGGAEPCAPFCVPDCFCCSRSMGAAPTIMPPAPGLLSALDAPVKERWPKGFRPVVDHPPLLSA
jgi:hypothetical protein